jgi:DNA helicase-2/ATP-dependent DNA helicase PcrA
MTTNLLNNLNEPQKEAVTKINGPLLIVAGPGSGKTRVLIARIANMIGSGISPENIVALTFTNKAAKEIKERLNFQTKINSYSVTTGTFHSFCSMILRKHGNAIKIPSNFLIYDDADQLDAIKRSMKDLDLDPKNFAPRSILSSISNAKSQLLDSKGFKLNESNYYDDITSQVYDRYEELLTQGSALDFDDLLLKVHTLLKNHPDITRIYSQKFTHLMVDEFQDTNGAQYEIAKLLSESHRNICVVGDPDQSIYSWRNADIKNITSFQTDFPESSIITLEENYRSTQTILQVAQNIIAKNPERLNKSLWTSNEKGSPIILMEGYNEDDEAQLAIKEVSRLIATEKFNLSDIAIMYRVNAQSRSIEMGCQKNGIPYQLIGGVKFYHRKEIKDLTAYLKIIINPHDDISLARIINTPTRGIGQRTINELIRISKISNCSIFDTIHHIYDSPSSSKNQLASRAITAISHFYELIQELTEKSKHLTLPGIIEHIVIITDYKKHIESDEQMEERSENISEFISSAKEYLNIPIMEALTNFIEGISLVSDIDNINQQSNSLTLITLHQSKGLEFPVVFMIGMEEGILPHIRSIESGEPSELEEERRLCYVGVTRAKTRLYMTKAFRRGFRGSSEPSLPSRFLSDLPLNLITTNTKTDDLSRPNESSRTSNKSNISGNLKKKYSNDPYITNSANNGIIKRKKVNKIAIQPLTGSSQPIKLKTGDKVTHKKFGIGIIMNIESSSSDNQLTIAFKNDGVKKLLESLANLSPV